MVIRQPTGGKPAQRAPLYFSTRPTRTELPLKPFAHASSVLRALPWATCALVGASAALAEPPPADALRARNLAATCTGCHGTGGRSVDRTIPALAGREYTELLQLLTEFKAGRRAATVMEQIARGYSDAQLERIAAWFAAQR